MSTETKNLDIHCVICTAPLSESRKRRHSSTCSERCKNKLDLINQKLRENTRCTHCLAPSSPDERVDFRRWRASKKPFSDGHKEVAAETKQLRDRSLANKKDLVRALSASTRIVEMFRDSVIRGGADPVEPGQTPDRATITDEKTLSDLAGFDDLIARNKQLLDKKPAE